MRNTHPECFFKGSQFFGQENEGSQIFRRKFKGSQINFKVYQFFLFPFFERYRFKHRKNRYNFRNQKSQENKKVTNSENPQQEIPAQIHYGPRQGNDEG